MLFLCSTETWNSIKCIKYLFRTFSICGTKLGPAEIQRGMTLIADPSGISQPGPGWVAQRVGASSPKGGGSDSHWGHIPRLWALFSIQSHVAAN